jgi:glucose dehydrogenase
MTVMKNTASRRVAVAVMLALAALLPVLWGQAGRPPARDWPTYNRDLAGTRFSPLEQINTKNVGQLKQVWTYRLRNEQGTALPNWEATPIVVNGVMYLPAGNRVVALEPETGKEIWRHVLKEGNPSRRGVAYWPGDRQNPPRIIFTSGRRMVALNAETGAVDTRFGKDGEVDLVVPYNSPPTIFRNIVMVGADMPDSPSLGPPGDSRAYDARTGAKLWEFHSVPRPGEPGHETWEAGSWKGRAGVNTWSVFMTVDQERGIVYTTFGSPNSDFYGGDRKGSNLFGNSVVAMDAETGKMKWHFQAVHHDLWNMDLPSAPGLIDIQRNGRRIPALALVTKSGLVFILDRLTGQPVFGIEERPVPQTDVPGEESSLTQPFPLKPPPLARNSYKPEDLVEAADTTPEHAKGCRDLVESSGGMHNAGPYTPYLYRPPGAPPRTTVVFPGGLGGIDWGGTATDPNLGYVFVNTNDGGSIGWIEKKAEGSAVPYDKNSVYGPGFGPRFEYLVRDEKGATVMAKTWPCQKPPWGRLTAVNAATGEFAWQVPLGVTDALPEGRRNTGRLNMGGPIVTAGGLVFIGATADHRFRAFDSRTGRELWATTLEYSANSVPITYQGRGGKQYVAIVAAGGYLADRPPTNNESLIVFALP